LANLARPHSARRSATMGASSSLPAARLSQNAHVKKANVVPLSNVERLHQSLPSQSHDRGPAAIEALPVAGSTPATDVPAPRRRRLSPSPMAAVIEVPDSVESLSCSSGTNQLWSEKTWDNENYGVLQTGERSRAKVLAEGVGQSMTPHTLRNAMTNVSPGLPRRLVDTIVRETAFPPSKLRRAADADADAAAHDVVQASHQLPAAIVGDGQSPLFGQLRAAPLFGQSSEFLPGAPRQARAAAACKAGC